MLDLSYGMPPGTICTHLLADMGMEVIKVEAPGGGHGARSGAVASERARAFDSHNRNKRSVVLNLKDATAREAFYRLAETADAMLESYRPGTAKRLGIDYESLRQRNDRLVYCSLSGFGQSGPYSQFGLHDFEASAARGAFYRIDADRAITPADCGLLFSDTAGGLHAAVGILTGLLGRSTTGRGAYIDVALADAVSTFNLGGLQAQLSGLPRRGGPSVLDVSMLRCADDKFLEQNNTEPANWARFCEVIGRPDFATYPEQDAATRERWGDDIRKIMRTRTRDEWFRVITATGASAAPCLDLTEVIADPQVRERGLIWELDHPTEGPVRQWGFPIQFKDEPTTLRSFAPRSGQDTAAVLAELGYGAQEIERITAPNST
jgi:crotonobetainyl-CoA:carnitine CoA-transferase CaiB-like acyl-CoA transferase